MIPEGFQPLNNRILVERITEPNGIIIVPDAFQRKSTIAKVICVGHKVDQVKRGDVVMIPGVVSQFPDWEEKGIALITEKDVAGIWEDYFA